jgi:predicted CoA-substrate-specific enzyme activase
MAKTEDSKSLYVGLDVGSLGAKSVIISESGIEGYAVIPTGVFPEKSGQEVMNKALSGLTGNVRYTIATGYGRITAKYADKTITEITCHAKGAHYLHPATQTIIDIGGQDCKVIRLSEDGNVADFAMNDKCAAGTGRFLEVISGVFKVPLEDLGDMSNGDAALTPINNTCTVFAETEIISLLARGEQSESILKGVFRAIASRVAGIASRIGVKDDVFFSGGVAKNCGVVSALREVLGCSILVPDFDPQLVGALGAAVIAMETNSGN